MPIIQKTPKSAIGEYLNKELERREKSIIRVLTYVGEACIVEARSNGDYIDQTGNLRSSIGYVILNNGAVVSQSRFENVKNGSLGKKEGSDFIHELIKKNSYGLVLIVVAGMNYAAHVETRRNVITSSELIAEQLVPKMLKQLGFLSK